MEAGIFITVTTLGLLTAGLIAYERKRKPNKKELARAAERIKCPQCQSDMRRHTFSEGNYKVVLGLFVLALGVALLWFFPIGTILGIIIILYALSMGGKRRKGWRCTACGYFFDTK